MDISVPFLVGRRGNDRGNGLSFALWLGDLISGAISSAKHRAILRTNLATVRRMSIAFIGRTSA